MDLLEDRQLAPFRKEYLEREKEIQRYIGVYLSCVVIVFSWMIGPQSKPLSHWASPKQFKKRNDMPPPDTRARLMCLLIPIRLRGAQVRRDQKPAKDSDES